MQNAIWPTAWRQPEVTAFRASMQAPEIDDATYERMCGYLDLAFTQAQAGPVCNGAVIVDSRQGQDPGLKQIIPSTPDLVLAYTQQHDAEFMLSAST